MSDETFDNPSIEAEFAKLSGYVSDVPYYRFPPTGSDKGLEFHRYLFREQAELERKFGFTADDAYQQYSTYLCNFDGFFEYKTALDVERERAAQLKPHRETNNLPLKAKKKISLADYKKKKETSSKPSPEEVIDHISRPSTASSPAPSTAASFVELNNTQPTQETVDIMATESHMKRSSPANKSNAHGLPPMLSPIVGPSNFELPPMLSPTLPPWVSKILEKGDHGPPKLLVRIRYSSRIAKKITNILERSRKRRMSSSADDSEGEVSTPKKVRTTSTAPAISPLAVTPSIPNGARPMSSSSNKEITSELRQMAMRHNNLGRELKHDSQRRTGSSESEKSLRALSFLDSVISYMLAYSYEDERQARSGMSPEYAKTWATLIPYAQTRLSGDFPELEGLQNYLLYAIHTRAIELALKSSSSGANSEENGTSRLGHEKAKFDAQLPTLFDSANRYLFKAHRTLHPDEMRSRLPTTWSGRMKVTTGSGRVRGRRGEEDLLANGGKKGPYVLPIDSLTTPAEAVRFAAAALKEWISSKKGTVDYDLRSMSSSV